MRWSLLTGCAYGITLHITLQIAYYDIRKGSRTALVASIDHETHGMRDVFLSLLTNEKYALFDDYKRSRLTSLQSGIIFQHYFDKPSLHKFVFPFKLLCNNLSLATLVKPRLSEYNSGVVNFHHDKRSIFTTEDRIAIVRGIGDQITLYGDGSVAFYALDNRIGDFSRDLDRARLIFEHPSPSSKSDYELKLEELEEQRDKINEFRYAAWCTILLCQMIAHSTASDKQKWASIREYLENVEIDHIPPFLITQLVMEIVACEIEFNGAVFPPIDASILKIQKHFPSTAGFGGNLATRNKQWIYYLHAIGGYRLQIPTVILDHTQLLEWWADYDHLGRSLLFRQTFDDPLSFLDHRGCPRVCHEISCLLDELALIMITVTSIVYVNAYSPIKDKFINVSDVIIKAYARTLASNILYREQIGNLPVSDSLRRCLGHKRVCCTPGLSMLRKLLTKQAKLDLFISIGLIQSDGIVTVLGDPNHLITSITLYR
ncbi:hypothetical protein PSACC_00190 [Paramicrosporidium saccamoebae]|uniref:Uncharacterized protein n=1 Tax=Paramicrosporidium saccamoebae TaxID=1246581 RepID=A0A2H9TQJ9_9FUNG|nr:hypothetical protein PSACC_00190 [Paramicrosporidium saccamoebae]